MKIIRKVARQFGIPALIAVLSGDLLILYYQGNWAEPIQFIEIFEVIFLYVVMVWAIAASAIAANRLTKGGHHAQ